MTKLSTLCYIEKDDKYLMLHRTVKENDVNKDKWIGVGGHFEYGESPEECLLREVKEETGYTLTSWAYRGIVINVKTPGDTDEITQAKMDFSQSSSISSRINTPEAYERLITACIKGERSWFSQWDQIETSWDFVEHLKDLYRWDKLPVFTYEQGSDGPAEADNLLKRFGDEWVF